MIHPDSSGLSHITFLEALLSTDEKMLKSIYVSNYQGVERYIIQNNGSTDDARDIYQEAFMAVWRNVKLQRFLPVDENEFAAYLYRVAKNKWIDQLRATRNITIIDMMDGAQQLPGNGADHQEENDYINAVKKHYSLLNAKCKELLTMFYFKKQSLKEIAAHFSWTEPSAKNNKYRCLTQLRTLIINKGK